MGRRRSFLGAIVRDLEKSANRAAAESRRQERRIDAMRGRAIEREMVRQEREAERGRIRAERDAERRRIADERERAGQQKQDAKEAQLRAWQLECEEHQAREQDIDRIANDSPEVEDRVRLYAELAERRVFEPAPFVPPEPPDSQAKVRKLRKQADEEVTTALLSFRSETRGARRVQIIAGAIGLGGVGLALSDVVGGAPSLLTILVGIAGVGVAQLVATAQSKEQRGALAKRVEADVQARLREALDALAREDEARAQAALVEARAAYDAETEVARRAFEIEEELGEGNPSRIREALDAALPLELPVPCEVSFDVRSPAVVALEIDVPEPSVVPATEAKLLASGKVTYKEKNEKRIREQYLRLVSGVAVRHASEVMLNLPSCQRVDLRAFRTALDPSIGKPARRCVLDVQFDYPTLAPLTMDGLDPVAALKHFQHRINLDRGRDLLALDA